MVKDYNELKDIAKKLMLENNYGIKEEELIYVTTTDITDYYKKISSRDKTVLSEVYGTEELPLIHHYITRAEASTKKLEMDEDDYKKNLMSGVKAYYVDDKVFYYVVCPSPTDQDEVLRMYVYTRDIYNYLCETALKDELEVKSNVPKSGIYRAQAVESRYGTYMRYKEITDIQSNPAIHQCKEELIKGVGFFFDNVEMFSKFNQKPLRKFLLCGEPGTGKTSICYDVAKKYSGDSPVVFVTDFQSMAMHIQECSRINRRTIVVFEDCEATLSSRNNSAILNFLDGIDRPNIENGAVVMMTTNHPERIEARISKRPGRIDKIFHINALDGKYAYDVFNLYFGDFMKENKFDATTDTAREAIEIIANGMTGAQIKELFNSYVCYMVSEGKEFNLTDIFDTKVKLFESFNQIDETNNSLTSNFENAQAELYKILRA